MPSPGATAATPTSSESDDDEDDESRVNLKQQYFVIQIII